MASSPAATELPQPDLEAAVRRMLLTAREAWPDLVVPDAAFLAHVAARLPAGADPAAVHAADLYLACACTLGDPRALAAFDRRILRKVRAALASFEGKGTIVEEALQAVREKLFLGSGDTAGRIGDYTGQGSLEGWVKVALTRTALNLTRGTRREQPGVDADAASEPLATSADPELAFIKAEHRGAFVEAFRAALAALAVDERNLLRFYLVDKLNITAIGAIFNVHRATVARWINDVRAKLLAGTHERLGAKLGLSRTEVESLVDALRSQLEVSTGWFIARGS